MRQIELQRKDYRVKGPRRVELPEPQKPFLETHRRPLLKWATFCGIWLPFSAEAYRHYELTWWPWWVRLAIALGPALILAVIVVVNDRE